MKLLDGKGSGNYLGVDSSNRALVKSTSSNEFISAIRNGWGFLLATSVITLTSANDSAIFYFKNNANSDLVIPGFALYAGTSTGGTNTDILFKSYAVITGGSIVTNEVPAAIVNLNISSTNEPDIIAYQGVEGDTITGIETDVEIHQTSDITRDPGTAIIPKGTTLGLVVQPPASNTSLKVVFKFNFYYIDKV